MKAKRIESYKDLPELPPGRKPEFIWHVKTEMAGGRKDYFSVIRFTDDTVFFKEPCMSCDGKPFSTGDNHFQEVVKWMKKKYGKHILVTCTYQDWDCGCYFMD